MTVPWFLGFPDITAWHIFILKYYLFIWHSPSSAFSLDVLSLVPLFQPSMLSVDELFSLGILCLSPSVSRPHLWDVLALNSSVKTVWNHSSLSSYLPLIHP